MRRHLLAGTVALAAVPLVTAAAGPAIAAETKPFICVDVPAAAEAAGAFIDAEALADAIRLEARRTHADVAVRVIGPAAPCPTRGRVLVRVTDGLNSLVSGGGRSIEVPLGALGVHERVPELAWAVIDFGVPPEDLAEAVELVDTDGDVWVPEPPTTDVAASREQPLPDGGPRTVGIELWTEGGYGFQPDGAAHRGSVGGEVSVALLDGRLAFGVAGGYQAAATRNVGDVSVAAGSGELLGVARGGLPLGPVLLRLGLHAGWQWRTIEASSAARFDELHASSGAAVIGGDLEVAWEATEWLRLGAAVRGRGYLGGSEYTFAGALVQPAPAGEVGVVLRVGVSLWP